MEPQNVCPQGVIFRNSTRLQLVMFLFIVVVMSNLNAIVDSVLHPEIRYFDHEHVIVGSVSGVVSAILYAMTILYIRNLENALRKIKVLESFLPICCNCKKIRISEDAAKPESWQQIESYITERTRTRFSHGLCPECAKKIYPDYIKGLKNGSAF